MAQNVNLNLLYSLKALLETRNLTHAAGRLGLAQSAMSRHLVQLRNEFQDPLLVREQGHSTLNS
jgi:DNA-binding transcriptional LysR family regulator